VKVLVVGSGGREHALAWKLARSPSVEQVFVAPGNAGTAAIARNVPIPALDVPRLLEFATSEGIDLTVVGPDDALAAGLVDTFEDAGLRVFGPRAADARLESSKSFAKDFMHRHGIPTAAHRGFTDTAEALEYCRGCEYPLVVKADGLALGKGVVIATEFAEAANAVRMCLEEGVFGEAGRRVVIEEFLVGAECSIHALVDGSTYLLLPDCRDHKKAHDGDLGPNTGGMGTLSPSGSVDEAMMARIREEILDPFVAGLAADGIAFKGMLFPGLMITPDGPRVLEFNCRWGDPETQVLVRRLDSDLLPLLEATIDGRLAECAPVWLEEAAACIVLASGGYPGAYAKGKPIDGLEEAVGRAGVEIFHAGTAFDDGRIVTSGGRVLGVTATGPSIASAARSAYAAADLVVFEKMQRRNDIGLPHPVHA
jgi:phosphoribosylamine---glycine ligase